MPAPQQNPAQGLRDFADAIKEQALAGARSGVSAELDQARSEREALRSQLDGTLPGSVRRDLQNQLRSTDLKIEKLQEALAEIGGQSRASSRPTSSSTTPAPQFPTFPTRIDPVPIIGTTLGILFVAFPIALTVSRYIWKRSSSPPPQALSQEQARRFDRIEQSVDAIAIEVERISENQRYLTKLLAEPKKQGLGVGQ